MLSNNNISVHTLFKSYTESKATVKSLFGKKKSGKKVKPKTKGTGIKRKGRLPAKLIINKLGNTQTVYYRPDQHTKSQYINPAKMTEADMMLQYKDSFGRMLFYDHGDMNN
jgi:hypothetical protein